MMPARVGRVRQQLCAACPAPCAAMAAGNAPFADPAHRCERGRFGAYDRATVAEPIPPLAPPRAPHWGPARWRELHTAARHGLLTPAWLAAFNAALPNTGCACRNHWRSVLAAWPPPFAVAPGPTPALPEAPFAWSWQAHNAVNAKLGKPLLGWEAALSLYPLSENGRHPNVTAAPPNSLDTAPGIGSVRF